MIGSPAPTELEVERWFQGGEDVRLDAALVTVIVFWEEWCPFCQRELPELQKTYEAYERRGLQVVGLTKITRKATEEGVRAFLDEHEITFPVAQETGSMSEHFNISGIPAVAVLRDGVVVWRGHPGRITTEMLDSWLQP